MSQLTPTPADSLHAELRALIASSRFALSSFLIISKLNSR